MTKAKFSIPRIAVLLIGLAVLIDGAVLLIVNNFNIGNVLTVLLGGAFLVYGAFYQRINDTFPAWLKIGCVLLLVLILVFVLFLLIYGLTDTVTYDEDAIIVLGAGLRGDVPSLTLSKRLDAAVAYHRENPAALIVVSGGQGPQETVSEASAMERYLIEKGVPQDRIIKEERSTSTYENFAYSKVLLDEHFKGDYRVAFITSEYHIYRAGGIAATTGIDTDAHLHSPTRADAILPSTLRESLAVIKFWIFKN